MESGQHFEHQASPAQPGTLGDVLYSDKSRPIPTEKEWVDLVQAIISGNQFALHALFDRAHRVVFTLISRITQNEEIAEELTVDVFCEISHRASQYDARAGTVLGWIMNRARSTAIAWRSAPLSRRRASELQGTSLEERLARRIAAETGGEALPPATGQWREPEWAQVAPDISCKLLATDTERHRVSMLVRLAPGGDYPPHTHAGVEELHLLDGELWIDDRKLYPGDYNRAEPGTGDKRVWSETGCTCVLMTSTKDILGGAVPETPDAEDTYRLTLVHAAELLGGAVPLARRLQVPMPELTRWLAGFDRPSVGTFLKVVDLVIELRRKSER